MCPNSKTFEYFKTGGSRGSYPSMLAIVYMPKPHAQIPEQDKKSDRCGAVFFQIITVLWHVLHDIADRLFDPVYLFLRRGVF